MNKGVIYLGKNYGKYKISVQGEVILYKDDEEVLYIPQSPNVSKTVEQLIDALK